MLQQPMLSQVEVGVDWVTATWSRGAEGDTKLARLYGWQLRVASEGNDRKPQSILGYEGWRCGGIFAGTRHDSHMMVVSSSQAHELWEMPGLLDDVKFTRLDLQVTAWPVNPMESTWAKDFARVAETVNRELPKTRRRTITLYQDNKGGATVYVGAPSSDERLCVYDKGAESEDERYAGAIRYEYRSKGSCADRVARCIPATPQGSKEAILSIVYEEVAKRGVPCIFPSSAYTSVPRVSASRITDVQRRLRWLREQVRPAIEKILTHASEEDILEALGLLREATNQPECS